MIDGKHPIVCRVSIIQGGAGFRNHPAYETLTNSLSQETMLDFRDSHKELHFFGTICEVSDIRGMGLSWGMTLVTDYH